jgi:hypothetical protein
MRQRELAIGIEFTSPPVSAPESHMQNYDAREDVAQARENFSSPESERSINMNDRVTLDDLVVALCLL